MSKLKDTLLMMAEQKENFKIGDKTFQIIEVVEAEQPQPDYSHLVGKWVKCVGDMSNDCVIGKWYPVVSSRYSYITIKDEVENFEWNAQYLIENKLFDLTNPQDSNPDEVKKILVPKEIGIAENDTHMGIIFGGNQVLLSPRHLSQNYVVWGTDVCTPIQCELIKCERAELVKGDVAFRTDYEILNLTDMTQYCVIIDNNSYCYIDGNDIRTRCSKYINWYKLIPINND